MEKEIKLRNNGFVNLFIGLAMIFTPLLNLISSSALIISITMVTSIIGVLWLIGLFVITPNHTRVLIFFGKLAYFTVFRLFLPFLPA
jgi:hypothetical protein